MNEVVYCIVLATFFAITLIALLVVHVHSRNKLGELKKEMATINRNLLKTREQLRIKEEEGGHASKSLMRTKQDLLALEKKLSSSASERQHAIENLRLVEQKLAQMEEHLQERDAFLHERDAEINRLRLAAEKAQGEAEHLRESLDNSVSQFETYASSLMRVRQKIEDDLTNERYAARKLQDELEQLRRENSDLRQQSGFRASSF